ncbi:MAG: polysaccharide deacetylase family protein, partial [Bacteroidales bacterium]|nr:polysaccharide deacetylase family protein [Bacteroidales bacterium]
MVNYRSSEFLIERLNKFEANNKMGLNGAFILIHPGTAPERTDKLYLRLEEIIRYYSGKGYIFKRL